eukprot:5423848-Amphidinium_carterae.1
MIFCLDCTWYTPPRALEGGFCCNRSAHGGCRERARHLCSVMYGFVWLQHTGELSTEGVCKFLGKRPEGKQRLRKLRPR